MLFLKKHHPEKPFQMLSSLPAATTAAPGATEPCSAHSHCAVVTKDVPLCPLSGHTGDHTGTKPRWGQWEGQPQLPTALPAALGGSKPRVASAPSTGRGGWRAIKHQGRKRGCLGALLSFSSPVLSVSHLSLPLSLLQGLKMSWRRRRGEEKKKKKNQFGCF